MASILYLDGSVSILPAGIPLEIRPQAGANYNNLQVNVTAGGSVTFSSPVMAAQATINAPTGSTVEFNLATGNFEVKDANGAVLATLPVINGDESPAISIGGGDAVKVEIDAAGTINPDTLPSDGGEGPGPGPGPQPGEGQTFDLTPEIDRFVGLHADDVINGNSATLNAGDVIIDSSTTDNDVLNLKLTATNALATIVNIETINVDWAAYTPAIFDAKNVTGTEVLNLSASQPGYLGNATVNNAGAIGVVAGAGITGSLTVAGATDVDVTAGLTKTVTVNAATAGKGSAAVTAGANTTAVTVGVGFDSAIVTTAAKTATVAVTAKTSEIDATAAAKNVAITVTGAAATANTATVIVGDDAAVTTAAFDDATGDTLTLDIADGKVVTLNSKVTTTVVEGAGAATLKTLATNLTGTTITKGTAGALTVDLTGNTAAATDLGKVSADLIKLTTAAAGTALTVANGQKLEIATTAAANGFVVGASGGTAATRAVDLTLTSTKYGTLATSAVADNSIAALTIHAAGKTEIAALNAATSTITLAGKGSVTLDAVETNRDGAVAETTTLVATDLEGTLTASVAALNDDDTLTIQGAKGGNTVTLADGAAGTFTFIGADGKDDINLGTLADDANVTVITNAGNDTVTVNITDLHNANAGLNIFTGAGNDTVVLAGNADDEHTNVAIDFGEGTDTLKINGTVDLKAGNVNIQGVDIIDLTAAVNPAAALTLSAAQYQGLETVKILSTGAVAGSFTVTGAGDTAVTLDARGITAASSANVNATVNLVGSDKADTIYASTFGGEITGGAGADKLIGNTGIDTFVLGATDSVAATAVTATKATFGNGVDVISGFTAGLDKLAVAGATLNAAPVADLTAAVTAANASVAYGSWNAETGEFTVGTFNAAGANNDALVLTVGANFDGSAGIVVVENLAQTLVALDFI